MFWAKKRAVVMSLLAILLLIIPVSCSEEVTTKQFDFSGFTKIEIGPAFKVNITQSSSYGVSITSNRMKHIEVTKEGDTLKIGLDSTGLFAGISTLEATITLPELNGLNLSGASNGTIQGFTSSNEFVLNLSGASRLSGNIDAGNVDFILSGASRVELLGSAVDLIANVSGASSIKLAGFEVGDADMTLSGASNGELFVNGTLDADLSGLSKLSVDGDPTLGDINLSGGSTID